MQRNKAAARWPDHRAKTRGQSTAFPSSVQHQTRDLLRHGVDDEGEEQSEDHQDHDGDDVLFELLPDQVDEGLHGIGEPGEAGGRATGGKRKMVQLYSRNFVIYYVDFIF